MSKQSRLSIHAEKAAFWQVHITAWCESGQSVRRYCESADINYDQFKYWQHRIAPETKRRNRQSTIDTSDATPALTSFVEIISETSEGDSTSVVPASEQVQLTVNLANRVAVEVSVPLNGPALKIVFESLKVALC